MPFPPKKPHRTASLSCSKPRLGWWFFFQCLPWVILNVHPFQWMAVAGCNWPLTPGCSPGIFSLCRWCSRSCVLMPVPGHWAGTRQGLFLQSPGESGNTQLKEERGKTHHPNPDSSRGCIVFFVLLWVIPRSDCWKRCLLLLSKSVSWHRLTLTWWSMFPCAAPREHPGKEITIRKICSYGAARDLMQQKYFCCYRILLVEVYLPAGAGPLLL